MAWQLQRIKIEGTNDMDVAYALAHLAEYSKGCSIRKINNIYKETNAEAIVVGFSKETMEKVGDDHPMLLGPNFIVSREYREPHFTLGEREWILTDTYIIQSDDTLELSSLVGKLEEEIRLAYSFKQ